MEENQKNLEQQRRNPLAPRFLVGTYVNSFHTDPNFNGPREIKQTATSPLAAYLSNKSYEKRDRKKGPSIEPLPLF